MGNIRWDNLDLSGLPGVKFEKAEGIEQFYEALHHKAQTTDQYLRKSQK